MRLRCLILIALVLASCDSSHVCAGDLANIRESTQRASRRASGSDAQSSNSIDSSDCDDDDGIFDALFGKALLFTVSSPWLIPHALLESQNDAAIELTSYPYVDDHEGYLRYLEVDQAEFKSLGLRFTSEYGNDFSGLERIGGRIQLESTSRWGLDTEWNHFRENVPSGTDSLWVGDANLVLRFAQNPRGQFYTGLGLNWLSGGQEDVGFNFTYGFDWFPVNPLVIRSVLDAGTVGNADLYHSKSTIGLIYHHVELFTGYDILHIGDTNLQGIIGGLSLWW